MTTNTHVNRSNQKLDGFIFRFLRMEDLPELEWGGEFIHFRRVYFEAYRRSLVGESLLWVVELPLIGIIGQAFVQLDCNRPELADGRQIAYIYGFRIMEPYRGIGLGSKLLQIIENDLSQRDIHFVTLNVAKDNERARALYERHGYNIVAEEPGCWSFMDHEGNWRDIKEPSWRMKKKIYA